MRQCRQMVDLGKMIAMGAKLGNYAALYVAE